MEDLVKSGKTRAIGVSNFSRGEMDRLLANCSITPAVHQFEIHPWLQQTEFVKYHQSKDIHVTQYSPLGNQNAIYGGRDSVGRLVDDAVLQEIGKKYGKTGAQVALGEFVTGYIWSDWLTGLNCSMGYLAGSFGGLQVENACSDLRELAGCVRAEIGGY